MYFCYSIQLYFVNHIFLVNFTVERECSLYVFEILKIIFEYAEIIFEYDIKEKLF